MRGGYFDVVSENSMCSLFSTKGYRFSAFSSSSSLAIQTYHRGSGPSVRPDRDRNPVEYPTSVIVMGVLGNDRVVYQFGKLPESVSLEM
jgi:hypothetical protein